MGYHFLFMPNITFSVNDELFERMKNFPEIKWTTLYRQTIEAYLDKLESPNSISVAELRDRLKNKGLSFDDLPLDKAIESYKKMRELKWERFYSTQTD